MVEGLLAAGAVGEVDLLKVGHHGSAASTTPRMMEALDPDVAVASAGEGNRYGHPAPECVEAVRSSGAEFPVHDGLRRRRVPADGRGIRGPLRARGAAP